MSENEFAVQPDREKDTRDDLVLTGEEIELPGEGSDASAIIGDTTEPIHTGEIESVAIGGLTGRAPAAAPLKPTIEDKISTGELPVVSKPAGAIPVVSAADEADSPSTPDAGRADQSSDAPQVGAVPKQGGADTASTANDAPAQETEDAFDGVAPVDEALAQETHSEETPTEEPSADEPAPASSGKDNEHADVTPMATEGNDASAPNAKTESIDEEPTQEEAAQAPVSDAPSASVEKATEAHETGRSRVMTPAQAAAALGLNLDSVREAREETVTEHASATDATNETPAPGGESADDEEVVESAEASSASATEAGEEPSSAVGGAAAEAPHVLPSRRSMIFGDDESFSPTIPALTPSEQQAANPAASVGGAVDAGSEGAPVDESTTQQPTRGSVASYSFEDQDKAERPRRRSVLTADEDTREAATLEAIASANRDRADKQSTSLDDELFSAAPEITEMPSRGGAHFLSFLLFLVLTPIGWYLAADAGARMTLADGAAMYTGVASILALGELLGAVIITVILCAAARRSSLGAWLLGVVSLVVGLPWVLAPGMTASSLLAALTTLSGSGPLGANLSHHVQASGYSGRFVLLGVLLMGLGYVSHSVRRTGRAEEALRTSIEAVNPAGALYSRRARKKAAKDLTRK